MDGHEKGSVRSKVLHTAAKMFLEKGYQSSTLREIAKNAGVNYGSLAFAFKNKENILCELVGFVLEGQFEMTAKLLLFSLKMAFESNGVGEIDIDDDMAKCAAEDYMEKLTRGKKGE